jgi:hypothetical protein
LIPDLWFPTMFGAKVAWVDLCIAPDVIAVGCRRYRAVVRLRKLLRHLHQTPCVDTVKKRNRHLVESLSQIFATCCFWLPRESSFVSVLAELRYKPIKLVHRTYRLWSGSCVSLVAPFEKNVNLSASP